MKDTQAFPSIFRTTKGEYIHGMTLRDYFAGQTVIGLAVSDENSDDTIAKWAYSLADAMLKERDKEREK